MLFLIHSVKHIPESAYQHICVLLPSKKLLPLFCYLDKLPSVFDVDGTLLLTFYTHFPHFTPIFPDGLVNQTSDLQNLNKSHNENLSFEYKTLTSCRLERRLWNVLASSFMEDSSYS